MGSYFHLNIKKFTVIESKSFLPPELCILFIEEEKEAVTQKEEGEEEEEYIEYFYKSTTGQILKRLSLIGITPKNTKKEFQIIKNKQLKKTLMKMGVVIIRNCNY
jgi:hypothetical protein